MEDQRNRARNARSKKGSMKVQRDLLIEIKTPSEYVGYTDLTVDDAELNDIILTKNWLNQLIKATAKLN